MFGCFSCGAVFEKALPYYEDSGELVYVCPQCYDYDLFFARQCARCGGPFDEAALRWGLCPRCAAEVSGRFLHAVRELAEEFDGAERAYLYEEFDGLF